MQRSQKGISSQISFTKIDLAGYNGSLRSQISFTNGVSMTVYLPSVTKLNNFSNISKAGSKKYCIHNKHRYALFGKGDRLHGMCWKLLRLIAVLALFIFSSVLIPLTFKFKSYKDLIEKLWKEGITGKEKNLSIYIRTKPKTPPAALQPKTLS